MSTKTNHNHSKIIALLRNQPNLSSSEVHKQIELDVELVTIKRGLSKLVLDGLLYRHGAGKATTYSVSKSALLFTPIRLDAYFSKESDQRNSKNFFDLSLIEDVLSTVCLFNNAELNSLEELQVTYTKNTANIPASIYSKELERLAIDLSWKSSQIEGNTYSLLETEQLLKEKKEAMGKQKAEATMLLNHKETLDFLIEEPDYIEPLTVAKIESIHSLLIKGLGVEKNIRTRLVGITGTNYKPLDNQFQIKEQLNKMCELINTKDNVFEKALLLLLLISYIQPFADGNKRTARIISNSILMHHQYCPLSFRTIDALDYKKAMLLFYEQNNVNAFKEIFIEQYQFAVKTYFL